LWVAIDPDDVGCGRKGGGMRVENLP
jgi:hypothetical protein